MSAISAGSPDAAMDTRYPAATAARAMAGPACPAPSTAIRGSGRATARCSRTSESDGLVDQDDVDAAGQFLVDLENLAD